MLLYNGIGTLNIHLTDDSQSEPFRKSFTFIADKYKEKEKKILSYFT